MLRSAYVVLDYHVFGSDGKAGKVIDFLFDDESWVAYYLVAELNGPDSIRQVLIPAFAVGRADWKTKHISVYLTKDRISGCASVEEDPTISLQRRTGTKLPGSHLRSMRELFGYGVYGADGEIGMLEDFIVEDSTWDAHYAVIGLNAGATPRSVLLKPGCIRSISWAGKAVWINRAASDLQRRQDFDPTRPVNIADDGGMFDYYGRPAPFSPLPGGRRGTEPH